MSVGRFKLLIIKPVITQFLTGIFIEKIFFQGFLMTMSRAMCTSTITHCMNEMKRDPVGVMFYFARVLASGKDSMYDPAVRRPLAAINSRKTGGSLDHDVGMIPPSGRHMVCIIYC